MLIALWSSFNTQPPEGGWPGFFNMMDGTGGVSTHSRLKAAGSFRYAPTAKTGGFNTQPPEGGWALIRQILKDGKVSTHSRLKAAGSPAPFSQWLQMFQHTAA